MEHIRFFSNFFFKLIGCLSNEHKDKIAGALVSQQFNKGQVIVG